MILRRLVEFWESQPDTVPTGYQKAFLTKRICLDRQGNLLGVVPLTGEKRGKREGMSFAVPREQPQRASGIRARLVHDNPNYALGMAGEEDKPEKVAARHAAYVKLLRECVAVTDDPHVRGVLGFVERGGPNDPRLVNEIDADGDDLLFDVEGFIPTDEPAVKAFWGQDAGGQVGRCLVTGEVTTVRETMPYPIKGVPGGQTSGTMLVSVNMPSGESYGLERGLNSPISTTAAEAICNGLNRLLSEPNHSYRVGDSVYVYWTRGKAERDALKPLKEPTPEEVADLRAQRRQRKAREPRASLVGANLATVHQGGTAACADAADFYVLSLTANASRIVVRDYHELTWPTAQANLGDWFERLALVGADGQPGRPFGARRLADSLYRETKDVPKHVPVALVRCALTGAPLPPALLASAVRRNVVMQGPFFEMNRKRYLSEPRLALIKAALIDLPRHQEHDLSALNPEHPDPAYHCGRLLSVLESIQRLAVPGLNATLTDRNYGAVSASPGTLFGGLVKDAVSGHLPKLRKNRPGAFVALDARLMDVLSRVGDTFPKTLDYEGQGLFALGYYHQRAHDVAEARARKAQNAADDLAAIAEAAETTPEETPA